MGKRRRERWDMKEKVDNTKRRYKFQIEQSKKKLLTYGRAGVIAIYTRVSR